MYSDILFILSLLKFYHFSEDEAGGFYLFVFEHLQDGKRLSCFKGHSKFSTWLYSVLRNLAIDFLRHQKEKLDVSSYLKIDSNGNLVNAIEDIPDDQYMPQDEKEKEDFQKLNDQLQQIKMSQRILFKLTYIHFLIKYRRNKMVV